MRTTRCPTPATGPTSTSAKPPKRPDRTRTVFLHSAGYYRLHLDASGPPDAERLKQISFVDGGAVKYAKELYLEYEGKVSTLMDGAER